MDHVYDSDIFIQKVTREQLKQAVLTQGTFTVICIFSQVFVHYNFRQNIYIIITEIVCKKDGGK